MIQDIGLNQFRVMSLSKMLPFISGMRPTNLRQCSQSIEYRSQSIEYRSQSIEYRSQSIEYPDMFPFNTVLHVVFLDNNF